MRSQALSIIACALFTVESIRLKTLHVLFFIDLHSRKVLLGGVTDGAANATWCAQIAPNLTEAREDGDALGLVLSVRGAGVIAQVADEADHVVGYQAADRP